ncbi:YkgJ family cysteine cluster protein [Conchiformibius steedae]|uniref:YkgJ family cysteine cluster protein n=1 Tax=Conchiformibius steedae TaxID=153493 RepID=A0A3P2A7W4_9NEIS|nr:YkgJ family cysteine cluster protein [Conchiformibius steedae]RRD91529.1 YkgJ family cysteine cluster protein [Conchiformibius steedae]
MREPFPCNACGKCCRLVNQSEQTAFLDRGDGVCRHFDESAKLCSIYATRPLVCRVEDYYVVHLSEMMTWQDFVQMNVSICDKLQQRGVIKEK